MTGYVTSPASHPTLKPQPIETMRTTITILGLDSTINMVANLKKLITVIEDQEVDMYEVMDGSYQIENVNLEIDSTP